MKLSYENEDVLVRDIMHAYDPAKAHQYYLRTRKLKGRKTGTNEVNKKVLKKVTEPSIPKRTPAQQLKDIRKKLELLKSRQNSGDVQKRVAAEKAKAVKAVSDIREEISTLNESLNDKTKTGDEKAAIVTKLDDAKSRLKIAEAKAKSSNGK